MKPLIIHGHFYQPPRENPWTGKVDAEVGASPFANWNERITAECYQPNAAVRVVDKDNLQKTVNNYTLISFDFGPTLLSWLAREHPETHSQIIAADAVSAQRYSGHGNAIAQAYSHAILPLCNERDMLTQVRWGISDFRYRFKREPESMWLPETACNDDVMSLLIEEGLRYVIMAPQQAARVRSLTRKDVDTPADWQSVAGDTVDTSTAYGYLHRDGSNRSIAVFFYDQEVAGAVAFGGALKSSALFLDRLERARTGDGDLVNVATDGESYGHHHKFGDLCLAYALDIEAADRGFSVTNYGEYLDQHPPVAEVEISAGPTGKGTAWSCVHGVSRWTDDCGCSTGAEPNWNQAWRRPLRAALDFLRDEAAHYFEATRGDLFVDPWAARDRSVELVLDPLKSREQFLFEFAPRALSRQEQIRALLFLEMQHNTLLMYASCGWFFNDISGIEPVQILKYACRVIDFMLELQLPSPRDEFLRILSEAQSNRPELGNGADIYRRMVESVRDPYLISLP